MPDDANGRLTIHLSQPDPELLDKLTNLVYPNAARARLTAALGAAVCRVRGPTRSRAVDHGDVTLTRNPYFSQWSAAAQPQGYPDVIAYRLLPHESAGIADVLDGRAHGTYAWTRYPSP